VDEFQDTNKIQYLIVKALASVHRNILAVGDEDQSIYGWRGANYSNIFDFIKDFDATVFKLTQNYRSTGKILKAANNIIKNNTARLPKELWTENDEGVRVEKYVAIDELTEADYVVNNINGLLRHRNYSCSDIAILVRLNALTRVFEEKLLYYNIPYTVFGGVRFYDRKEIKDILAYLRIIANPSDNEAVLRAINTPRRGIGDKAVAQLVGFCNAEGKSLTETIRRLDGDILLPKPLINKLQGFSDILNDIFDKESTASLEDLFDYIVERSGLKDEYAEDTEENNGRRMNISEFRSSVREFCQNSTDASLNAYLESVTLMSDIDSFDEENNHATIATIHSVKGLEFKVVFIVGMDESIFPMQREGTSDSDVEEERRLAYVAVTRAKERLYLTRASSRFLYGTRRYLMQSRFFAEVGDEKKSSGIEALTASGVNIIKPTDFQRIKEHDPRLKIVGTVVMHKKFGSGRILNVSGTGENMMIEVDFQTGGRKVLTLSYAPLEVIV
ncbi:MAG: UvrD-helicase domain-containing protein, partial [Clostridiales bacterium]|jgi:DNA helicase-2/ATP-dependent DNA helicase PcrA|nr:UvrD-helicase domain-containing protein [Clostridiales bacterium]